MKKLSVKKLLIVIALIAMVAVIGTKVQATGGAVNPLLNIQGSGTANTTTNTTTTNTATTNTTTTNTVKTNTAGSNYQNTNLPQTGDASDYAIFLFIAVCIVVAIYAYRKYRNYNI